MALAMADESLAALPLIFQDRQAVVDRGTFNTMVKRISNDIPQPPSARNPRIMPELDAIVLKALHKDPALRFANAGEMRRELDRIRVSNNAGERVEIAFALLVPEPAAFAPFKGDGQALVCVHDVRHCVSTPKSNTAAAAAVNPEIACCPAACQMPDE